MDRPIKGLLHILLLLSALKSFANAGSTNPAENFQNFQNGPGSLPAVMVLVVSLVLLALGSALVTFHYCRREAEEHDINDETDESKTKKLDNVEYYDQLTYDKMDDGDGSYVV